MANYVTIVMEHNISHIHYSRLIYMHFRSSYTMMTWKCATLWGQNLAYIKSVHKYII